MRANIYLAILIIVVLCAGTVLHLVLQNYAPIAVASVVAALLTFFVLASETDIQTLTARLTPENRLRTAIASALIVEYLILVGFAVFIRHGPEKLTALTDAVVTSFTATIGVVIAFYFGASAYVEASKHKTK